MTPIKLYHALLAKADLNTTRLARAVFPGNAQAARNLQSKLSKWETGESKEPTRRTLGPVAKFLGIDIEALYSAKAAAHEAARLGILNVIAIDSRDRREPAPVMQPRAMLPEGYVRMPVMAEAGAGPGRVFDGDGQEVVQYVDVLGTWARERFGGNPRRLRVLTVHGRSMTGVVEDGDLLFVEPCTEFGPDGLYIISRDNLLRVKRLNLRIADGLLSIESTDGRAPEIVPLSCIGDSLLIQGRVVGAWVFREV